MMEEVFVFGTLKRGFPLHERGLAGAQYLGEYRTVAPYPMFVAGPWFAPMLLDQPGRGLRVQGELYLVNGQRLAQLDALESVGKPGNLRIAVEVEPLRGGPAVTAFAYAKSPELASPAHSGFLADYRDARFIPPEER